MVYPVAFDEFTARVLALYSTGRHARKTRLRMAQVLRELAALGVATTADLTTATMARYVAARGPGANPNTVNGLLSAVAAACSYAVEEGWLGRPPAWRRVRLRPAPMTLNVPPGHDAVAALLARLHEGRESSWEARRLCALTWTVALTGVRLGEALHAQVGDLEEAGSLHVNPARRRLKTAASDRFVPLPEALMAVLADWLPHDATRWLFPGVRGKGPWTGGSSGTSRALDALKIAAAGAGTGRITWHSLRHAFGTSALERWDVPLWVVQRVLGHTDVRTTQRYLHTEGSPAIARAMRGVRYRLPEAG